jgi:hypothetical protein
VKNPTFNLTALADRLFAEKRMLPLCGQNPTRARDLHSLGAELTMALETLDALRKSCAVKSDDFKRHITEWALLNSAIVLYVRATKTRSDERGDFDPRARFNDEQRVAHQELIDLRDEAIAHFRSGGSYRGEWQTELTILQIKGADGKVGVAARRQTFDLQLVQRARRQIEFVHTLFRALALEKLDEVMNELDLAAAADPDFYKEFERRPLNLDIFLASPAAGKAARDAFDDEVYVKGSVRHN